MIQNKSKRINLQIALDVGDSASLMQIGRDKSLTMLTGSKSAHPGLCRRAWRRCAPCGRCCQVRPSSPT